MSVPEIPSKTASTSAAELLERLGEKLGGRASVSAAFGEPVAHGDVVIVPVANIGFGFGAGAGRGRGEGGGGGGGTSIRPVGYIEIKNGNAVFRPIRHPLVDVLVPVASLIAATVAPRIVRGLLRRTRKVE